MSLEPTPENQINPPIESGQSEVEISDKQRVDDLISDAEQELKYLKINREFYSNYAGGEMMRESEMKIAEKRLIEVEILRDEMYKYWDDLI